MKKKTNNKGFTLVEVIVVLVILSILAALLVPSLTGYIDKASAKASDTEARMVAVAVQTVLSEYYAQKEPAKVTGSAVKGAEIKSGTGILGEIYQLAEVEGTISDIVYSGNRVIGLKWLPKASTNVGTWGDIS